MLPANDFYAVGADWGMAKRPTVIADFLGQRFLDAPRASPPVSIPVAVQPGLSFPSVIAERGPFTVNNGLKADPWGAFRPPPTSWAGALIAKKSLSSRS